MIEINPAINKHIFESKRREIYWRLKEIGLEEQECQAEARLIIEHISGIKQAEQLIKDIDQFPEKWQQEITRIINMRAERRPLAYCLGEIEFAGLIYRVVPGVLIPRTDTETLIEVVVEWVEKARDEAEAALNLKERTERSKCAGEAYAAEQLRIRAYALAHKLRQCSLEAEAALNLNIAEIGIGSGIIAISLLKRLPNCKVWACDISQAAITTAWGNARRHGVHERLTLVHGDWRKVLPNDFDVIVSNPPYVSSGLNCSSALESNKGQKENAAQRRKQLEPEIFYEPKEALFAGEDGLDFYRDFARVLPRHYKKAKEGEAEISLLGAFEIGDKQEQSVLAIFKNNGWQNLQSKKDINGLPRVILGNPI